MSTEYAPTQTRPCPHCKVKAGWWSGLTRLSAVFHAANGEVVSERLFESRRKFCHACDLDITDCIGKEQKP